MTTEYLIKELTSTKHLVFGVQWHAMIGDNLEKLSLHRAASEKASHYVEASERSPSAGFVKIKGKAPNGTLYSAAAVFAQSHSSGVHYSCIEISEGLYWFVATHDGLVISGTDVLGDEEHVEALVADLVERHSGAQQVEGDTDILQHCDERTQLRVRKGMLATVPMSIKVVFVLIISLAGYDTINTEYQKRMKSKMASEDPLLNVDAYAEWNQKINAAKRTVLIDSKDGFEEIYKQMTRIPYRVGGWVLHQASCGAVASGWTCRARFKKTIYANNRSFQSALPAGWVPRWEKLEEVSADWSIPATRKTLAEFQTKTKDEIQLGFMNDTQLVMPALSSIQFTGSVKLNVESPVVYDSKGQAFTVPFPEERAKDLKIPTRYEFTIDSPMRSLTVMPIDEATAIKSITMEVSVPDAISVRRSTVNTILKGEYYAD